MPEGQVFRSETKRTWGDVIISQAEAAFNTKAAGDREGFYTRVQNLNTALISDSADDPDYKKRVDELYERIGVEAGDIIPEKDRDYFFNELLPILILLMKRSGYTKAKLKDLVMK